MSGFETFGLGKAGDAVFRRAIGDIFVQSGRRLGAAEEKIAIVRCDGKGRIREKEDVAGFKLGAMPASARSEIGWRTGRAAVFFGQRDDLAHP